MRKIKGFPVSKRIGNWYQICDAKKQAYLPIEDAREVFTTEEQAVLTQVDKKECESSYISCGEKT